MKLIVLIPALNEEATIRQVIQGLPSRIDGIDQQQVFVIDDGSTDATAATAEAAGAKVFRHWTNLGLGAAFQTGIEMALRNGADVIATIDADGQFHPNDLPALIHPIVEQRADVVTASRFRDPSLTPKLSFMKRFGNNSVAGLVSWLSGQRIYDVACGFRAYSREAALHLNVFSMFTYTQESLMNLIFKQFHVLEIPIRIEAARKFGRSRISSNLLRYAFYTSNTMFRTLLDYRPLRVFGWTGLLIFLAGVACELFVLVHYLDTKMVTPYKTVGFIGGLLNLIGLAVIIVGLIADMINRVRMTQERIMTMTKRSMYG